jgi:hypothetical protein
VPPEALAQHRAATRPHVGKGIKMMDLLMLAIGLGLFALSLGYAYACERL